MALISTDGVVVMLYIVEICSVSVSVQSVSVRSEVCFVQSASVRSSMRFRLMCVFAQGYRALLYPPVGWIGYI